MIKEAINPVSLAQELAGNPQSELLRRNPLGIAKVLLESALDHGTTERSLFDAHVKGMHSLMLYDREQTGGGKIRLFYTVEGANPLNHIFDPNNDYSCRPHDHRFDITIVPVVNSLWHMRTEEKLRKERKSDLLLNKFIFSSAVESGAFGLKHCGLQALEAPEYDMLVPGDTLTLSHDVIHSVTSYEYGKQSTAAWLVVEGPEVTKTPLLFSKEDVPDMNATGLYIAAGRAGVKRIINDTLERMTQS